MKKEYEKYEFCKSVNCPFLRDKCIMNNNCIKTAREFHHWLNENGFSLLKESPIEENKMSMNLYLEATLPVQSKLGDKKLVEHFELYQTPTVVTRSILNSEDTKQAYINWVKQYEVVEQMPTYREDDMLCQDEPIGTHDFNMIAEHISELEEWISQHSGWNIEWYEM